MVSLSPHLVQWCEAERRCVLRARRCFYFPTFRGPLFPFVMSYYCQGSCMLIVRNPNQPGMRQRFDKRRTCRLWQAMRWASLQDWGISKSLPSCASFLQERVEADRPSISYATPVCWPFPGFVYHFPLLLLCGPLW